jgi:hypothetical protein
VIKLDAGDGEFETLLAACTGSAREHTAFEEIAVWPRLRTALNTERRPLISAGYGHHGPFGRKY